jgi:hypothetical protein
MNPYNVYSYPFSGSSFPNSGSSCPSNGSSYPSSGSLYLGGGPLDQRIPTYHPTPGAPSGPINTPWQAGTQHWSQPGLTAAGPPGGHCFNLPGGHTRLQTLEALCGSDMDSWADLVMHRGREVSLRGYASHTGPGRTLSYRQTGGHTNLTT